MTYCTLVIPNKDRHGKYLPAEVLIPCIRDTLDSIVAWSGGCTILRGVGHWKNEAGILLVERVRVLCTYADASAESSRVELSEIAIAVARRMDQESVLYSVNHTHYFGG